MQDDCNAVPWNLPLAELEALACSLLSVLLALFTASIAGEEAFNLQLLTQLHVKLQQGAGNAHLQSPSLAIDSAAINIGVDIKSGRSLAHHQRLADFHPLRVGQKVLVELTSIHSELTAAGPQKNACHARLATPGTVILNLFSHLLVLCSCPSPGTCKLFLPLPACHCQRLRLLCLMHMLVALINLELLAHGTAELCFGQHAQNCVLHYRFRLAIKALAELLFTQSARKPGVVPVDLLF